ncbi:MAG: bifunctional adenosylcobinamide kinase/adenosylcobinamide-phosphate guanylyltransferase [Chloroflexi bacterium]|nr:bifunctional adenosylcobinamide kinase/adenosylcobinamide-phosphate guanylyltransferase [Chloroflexota bacterium]
MGGRLVLVIGGVRSGKSRFAERLAASWSPRVLYIATARPTDPELAARVAAHRARRPSSWSTSEEPLEPARAIAAASGEMVVLLDSLTLLVANALTHEPPLAAPAAHVERVVRDLIERGRAEQRRLIVVTDEVGQGGVALSPLGRRFADLLGDANQALAAAADHVYYLLAGLAVDWRALAAASGDIV